MSKNTPVLQKLIDAQSYNDMVVANKILAKKAICDAKEMIMSDKKSTGDLLHDYVIVTTHGDDSRLLNILHHTEDSLSDKVGELILLIYTYKRGMIKNHSECRSEGIIYKELFLAVLTGDKLIVNPQEEICYFPTERLIKSTSNEHMFNSNCLTLGNLVIRDLLNPNIANSWELVVGSLAVSDWMKRNIRWEEYIIDMADRLDKIKDLKYITPHIE